MEVRFIEWMPLDGGEHWSNDQVVPASEIIAAIDERWPLLAADGRRASDSAPAESYAYADGRGQVGVIASVTRPFCASCDRIRLTAEGQLRNCLFSVERPICGPSSAVAAATTTWPAPSRPRWDGSGPAMPLVRSPSSDRPAA